MDDFDIAFGEQIYCAENLFSAEQRYLGDGVVEPYFSAFYASVHKGEVKGISGSTESLRVLGEVLGGVRAPLSGSIRVCGEPLVARRPCKKMFYMNSGSMLYDDMNVTEFLMMAARFSVGRAEERQKYMLELLQSAYLTEVALMPVKQLRCDEKFVISVIAAKLTDNMVIAVNACDCIFSDEMKQSLAFIVPEFKKQSAVIFLSNDMSLLSMFCNEIIYIDA